MKPLNSQTVDLQTAFAGGADMSAREKEILDDIVVKTKFLPQKVIWRSSYWGTSQIGAVHYLGTFASKPAVLKIQGVKPAISETLMIEQFATQNRSLIIRPPLILFGIPWDDKLQYEVIIMEHVTGEKVLKSKTIQTAESIGKFLNLYLEYRHNCLPKTPWLPTPKLPTWNKYVEKMISTSLKAYPDHPYRLPGDFDLCRQGTRLLSKIYQDVSLEFVHGHFSVEDLIYQKDEVILFSNLFWKWRMPYYDAVFGYHWFIYELSNIAGITSEQIEQQRGIWMSLLLDLPWVKESNKNMHLAKAALLERAVAGLIIDSFLTDKNKVMAKYLTDSTRDQVKKLISELS